MSTNADHVYTCELTLVEDLRPTFIDASSSRRGRPWFFLPLVRVISKPNRQLTPSEAALIVCPRQSVSVGLETE